MAYRLSDIISGDAAANLLAAARHAVVIDRPLNRFETIAWGESGVVDAREASVRLLELKRRWFFDQGMRWTCVWVREVGDVVGDHLHLALHVPPQLTRAMSARHRLWIATCGGIWTDSTYRSRPIGRDYRHAFDGVRRGARYEDDLARIIQYMLKGVGPIEAATLSLRHEAQGRIVGKRVGASRNLDQLARRQWLIAKQGWP